MARGKHKAHIARARAKYDRRIKRHAQVACVIIGHRWVTTNVEFLATKTRYTDTCMHCEKIRIQLVTEH